MTVRKPKGVRCQGVAVSTGERCNARSYALVRVVDAKGHWREQWLCGSHQARLRKEGYILHLVRRWRGAR